MHHTKVEVSLSVEWVKFNCLVEQLLRLSEPLCRSVQTRLTEWR